MNEGLIPRRYAKALYALAVERQKASVLYGYAEAITAAFAAEPQLEATMANPFVADSDKQALLLTAANATAQQAPLLSDFLRLLVQNRRMPQARAIFLAYGDIYRRANRIFRVRVTAAAPMDADDERRLKELIGRHLKGATMEYTFAVDPALIGGFRVDIDNESLDASVANDLKQLRLRLLNK